MFEFSDTIEAARKTIPAVSPQEACALKTSDQDVLFIDPRGPVDILATTGLIPGAINLPLDTLSHASDDELPQELAEHTRPIITTCQGGPLGAVAAYVLKQRGFNNVHFIDGGTQGWLDAGYATIR